MSGWRKCDTCRKVKASEEFDGDSPTCRACLTAPVRRRAAPVTKAPAAPRAAKGAAAAAEPRVKRPLMGAVGMGDLEVRERRAKRAAWEALAASHPEEFALLLRDKREAEGLRPISSTDGAAAGSDGPAAEPSAGVEAPSQA